MTTSNKTTGDRNLLDTSSLLNVLLGGHAVITVTNTRTNRHVTLKFSEPRNPRGNSTPPLFVSVFTGNREDDSEFRSRRAFDYAGMIWRTDRSGAPLARPEARYGERKARVAKDDAGWRTAQWLLHVATGGTKQDYMQIWHEGICCFCGRELTQTESVRLGYGPCCAKKRGLPYGTTSKPERSSRKGRAKSQGEAPKAERTLPALRGDETWDERVSDLMSAGLSEQEAEQTATDELMQAKERHDAERAAKEKAERERKAIGAQQEFRWV